MISIHTTAKVVTWGTDFVKGLVEDFNPHHREGGDDHHMHSVIALDISIHTTAKVVTQ